MASEENWRDFEYVVRWVEEMQGWAAKYQIYEFIPADQEGLDPTERITDHAAIKIKRDLIWTVYSSEERVIQAGVQVGTGNNWYVHGWYVGRIPHTGSEVFDEMKYLCHECEGKRSYSVEEDGDEYEVDCERCTYSSDFIEVIHLQDTGFSLPLRG